MREESSWDLSSGGEGGSLLCFSQAGGLWIQIFFSLLEDHKLGGFDALGVGDKYPEAGTFPG